MKATTLISCSANGDYVPPMILYPDEDDNGVIKPYYDNLTSEVMMEWFNEVFIPFIKELQVETPVLLVMSKLASFITQDIEDMCTEASIILHHIDDDIVPYIQPLEMFFLPIMHKSWDDEMKLFRRGKNARKMVSQSDFGPIFARVFKTSAISKVARYGFTRSGMFPFDKSVPLTYEKPLGTMEEVEQCDLTSNEVSVRNLTDSGEVMETMMTDVKNVLHTPVEILDPEQITEASDYNDVPTNETALNDCLDELDPPKPDIQCLPDSVANAHYHGTLVIGPAGMNFSLPNTFQQQENFENVTHSQSVPADIIPVGDIELSDTAASHQDTNYSSEDSSVRNSTVEESPIQSFSHSGLSCTCKTRCNTLSVAGFKNFADISKLGILESFLSKETIPLYHQAFEEDKDIEGDTLFMAWKSCMNTIMSCTQGMHFSDELIKQVDSSTALSNHQQDDEQILGITSCTEYFVFRQCVRRSCKQNAKTDTDKQNNDDKNRSPPNSSSPVHIEGSSSALESVSQSMLQLGLKDVKMSKEAHLTIENMEESCTNKRLRSEGDELDECCEEKRQKVVTDL